MCRVNVFCCGCSLRAGAITAAVLTMIDVIFLCISCGLLFSGASNYEKQGYKDTAQSLRIYAIMYLISALVGLVIFICLVLALRLNRSGYCIPWLVGAMIQIVVIGINVILGVSGRAYYTLVALPFLAFLIYLWIVVLNFYRELRDGGSGRQIGKV